MLSRRKFARVILSVAGAIMFLAGCVGIIMMCWTFPVLLFVPGFVLLAFVISKLIEWAEIDELE